MTGARRIYVIVAASCVGTITSLLLAVVFDPDVTARILPTTPIAVAAFAVPVIAWLAYFWWVIPVRPDGPTGDPDMGPGDGPGPNIDPTPIPGDGTPTEWRRGQVLDDMTAPLLEEIWLMPARAPEREAPWTPR